MGRLYTLKCNDKTVNDALYAHKERLVFGRWQRLDKCKVVLISNPKFGSLVEIVDYKAFVLDNYGTLHMISIKHGIIDRLPHLGVNMYDDVVIFQESIFVVDSSGRLYRMGYNDTKLERIVWEPVGEGSGSDMKKRLVVDTSNSDLYLLHKTPSRMKSIFKVYKMNLKYERWDEVAGIGVDRILVAIDNRCFFIKAKYIHGLGGNCILFHNSDFRADDSSTANLDSIFIHGSFSFQDGCFKTVPGDLFPWFWPPPRWVLADTNLFNCLSIPERVIVRDFCNHVFPESRCTRETCVADAILLIKDKNKGIRKLQHLARDHLRRKLNEQENMNLDFESKTQQFEEEEQQNNSQQMASIEQTKPDENVSSLVEEQKREKEEALKKIMLLEKELVATQGKMKEMTVELEAKTKDISLLESMYHTLKRKRLRGVSRIWRFRSMGFATIFRRSRKRSS